MSTQLQQKVTSFTLYQESQDLLNHLYECEGVADELFDEALREFLEKADIKFDSYRYALAKFKAEEQLFRQEVQRLQKKAQAMKQVQDNIKKHVEFLMDTMEVTPGSDCEELKNGNRRVKTDKGSVTLQRYKRLEVRDEDELLRDPKYIRFHKVKMTLDKTAIIAELKEGDEVDHCDLVDDTKVVFR